MIRTQPLSVLKIFLLYHIIAEPIAFICASCLRKRNVSFFCVHSLHLQYKFYVGEKLRNFQSTIFAFSKPQLFITLCASTVVFSAKIVVIWHIFLRFVPKNSFLFIRAEIKPNYLFYSLELACNVFRGRSSFGILLPKLF